MLVTAFERWAKPAKTVEPSSYAVQIDPASFLAEAAKGAKLAPTLEEATVSAVKACGPEFGEFLAQRYGGRVAKAALAACGEGLSQDLECRAVLLST